MHLADSHVHLHSYADVDGLLTRARRAGVDLIVGVAIDLPTSRRTIEIARRHSVVVAAVGLHPVHLTENAGNSGKDSTAGSFDSLLTKIEALAKEPHVGFVGEIGLDLVDGMARIELQRDVFAEQLRIAQRLGLPVNLHVRGAFDETFEVLEQVGVPSGGAILHYFVGDEELARRALGLGLCISVGKPVSRPENDCLRSAVRTISLDRLILETDSYPLPGRTTEPADVLQVAQAVAGLLGRSPEEVADITSANLRRLLPSFG